LGAQNPQSAPVNPTLQVQTPLLQTPWPLQLPGQPPAKAAESNRVTADSENKTIKTCFFIFPSFQLV